MKNKLTTTLIAAFALTVVSQDIAPAELYGYSMFIPSFGIEAGDQEDNDTLVILDGDRQGVEYTFKLAELFNKLFN